MNTNEARFQVHDISDPLGFYHWDNRTWFALAEQRLMTCDLYTAMYTTSLTYVKGVQNVSYSTAEERPLAVPLNHSLLWTKDETQSIYNTTLDNKSQDYLEWELELSNWRHKVVSFRILDMLFQTIAFERRKKGISILPDPPRGTSQFPNGTEVELYPVGQEDYKAPHEIPQDTNFNANRYSDAPNGDKQYARQNSYLDITEESINSALANISISAISLHRWNRSVEVNNTQYVNVYRFSDPTRLFVPYGLCLASALMSAAIGLKALHDNGVPAFEGGFLQIMSTTRGDTQMSRAVGSQCAGGGKDHASEELLDVKVRFGELVDGDDGGDTRRLGFGTEEETVMLRKRK